MIFNTSIRLYRRKSRDVRRSGSVSVAPSYRLYPVMTESQQIDSATSAYGVRAA